MSLGELFDARTGLSGHNLIEDGSPSADSVDRAATNETHSEPKEIVSFAGWPSAQENDALVGFVHMEQLSQF